VLIAKLQSAEQLLYYSACVTAHVKIYQHSTRTSMHEHPTLHVQHAALAHRATVTPGCSSRSASREQQVVGCALTHFNTVTEAATIT
jgi:hypothetical protein